MRVGVVHLPQERWASDRARWERVEEWGFDHAWTYDHLAWRTLADEPWLATVPLLAAAAAVTSRIRLGTWVASPNYRHPVPFAKDVMGLDDVAAGRLTLGVGAGGGGFDAEVLGEALGPRERADRFAEFVELLDALLTRPVTDHEGRFYGARGARMVPGCVQRPRVPFVVAANGPQGMALAARYGQGWATTGPVLAMGDAGSGAADDAWWDGVAALAARFEEVCRATGRDPATVDRFLNVDAAPVFSLASVERAVAVVHRAVGLGFTDVVWHWPRERGVYAGRVEVLTEVAGLLPGLRAVQPRR